MSAPDTPESLEAMLARLGIESYDLILVGDGSGNRREHPIGWACVALEKNKMERRVSWGAMNHGTNNEAELLAYLEPLQWYLEQTRAERNAGSLAARHVHIITDSQYAQGGGTSATTLTKRKNSILWTAFELVHRQGIVLHWHWIDRDTIDLNKLVDALSRAARIGLTDCQVHLAVREALGLDAQNANPWE